MSWNLSVTKLLVWKPVPPTCFSWASLSLPSSLYWQQNCLQIESTREQCFSWGLGGLLHGYRSLQMWTGARLNTEPSHAELGWPCSPFCTTWPPAHKTSSSGFLQLHLVMPPVRNCLQYFDGPVTQWRCFSWGLRIPFGYVLDYPLIFFFIFKNMEKYPNTNGQMDFQILVCTQSNHHKYISLKKKIKYFFLIKQVFSCFYCKNTTLP